MLSQFAALYFRQVLMNLRSDVSRHTFFGYALELNENHLPTNREIGQAYLSEKRYANEALRAVCQRVATKVINIWNKASIPTVSERTVQNQIKDFIADCQNTLRSKTSENRKREINEKMDCLFDICSCKCKDLTKCICTLPKKVIR